VDEFESKQTYFPITPKERHWYHGSGNVVSMGENQDYLLLLLEIGGQCKLSSINARYWRGKMIGQT
jgi:hypothetical protein